MCACTNCLSETKTGLKSKLKSFVLFFFFLPVSGAFGTLNVSLPRLLEERCHLEGSVREPQLQTLLCIKHTAGVQPAAEGILASSSSSLCFKATSKATGPWLMGTSHSHGNSDI